MGQLDLYTAQAVATERERDVTRRTERRRTAVERDLGTRGAVIRARRRYGLMQRLHLAQHPAR